MAKLKLLLALFITATFALACGEVGDSKEKASSSSVSSSSQITQTNILEAVQEEGKYTTKDSVAAYIHKFKKLPSNYVNKSTGQTLYETETGKAFSNWNFNPQQVLGVMISRDDFLSYTS